MLVHEIFSSISGEVGRIPQGSPVTFVRFQGCNLNCSYCDTPNTIDADHPKATEYTPDAILECVHEIGLPVVLTGGEPMVQRDSSLRKLAELLNFNKIEWQMETNGTMELPLITMNHLVMDYKPETPPLSQNIELLGAKDWLKFVISKQEHLELVRHLIPVYGKKNLAITTTYTDFYPKIVKLLVQLKSRAVVNVQIHKIMGVP